MNNWQGTFVFGGQQYLMEFSSVLIEQFPGGIILISGSDSFGNFTMEGKFVPGLSICEITKRYKTHTYCYRGQLFTQNKIQTNENFLVNSLHRNFLQQQQERVYNQQTPNWVEIKAPIILGVYGQNQYTIEGVFKIYKIQQLAYQEESKRYPPISQQIIKKSPDLEETRSMV